MGADRPRDPGQDPMVVDIDQEDILHGEDEQDEVERDDTEGGIDLSPFKIHDTSTRPRKSRKLKVSSRTTRPFER